jgi:PIN domain nuclease of toxin-antitoxin system
LALLLDTNVIVWYAKLDKQLSRRTAERLTAGADDVYVSVVSGWEYGQKRKLYPVEFLDSFEELIAGMPVIRLGLEFDVHRLAETLPLIHRDPFDRMLVAQAIHHGFELVASDSKIHRYPVRWFW